MNIAIVGARERKIQSDVAAVQTLLKLLKSRYPALTIITCATDIGIGKYVKDACLVRRGEFYTYSMKEVIVKAYPSREFSKTEYAEMFIARNASVYEQMDQLYYFATAERRGTFEDLVVRCTDVDGEKGGSRPYKVLLPGDEVTLLDLGDEQTTPHQDVE